MVKQGKGTKSQAFTSMEGTNMYDGQFFHQEEIRRGVIRITGAGNELMYLIIGTKKAALIDTGIGLGNIRTYVEALTNLPITVILTHAHMDHSGGCFYFDHTYLNSVDAKLLNAALEYENREEFVQGLRDFVSASNPKLAKEFDESQVAITYPREFKELSDGDLFDLGGVTLEIITCPGHTMGSVVILIKEYRMLILGDSCNPYVWLHLPESSSVEVYRESLLNIKAREKEYDRVLLSHMPNEVGKGIVDEVIRVCDEILNATSEDFGYKLDGYENTYVAKPVSRTDFNIREDGRIGNIMYKKC